MGDTGASRDDDRDHERARTRSVMVRRTRSTFAVLLALVALLGLVTALVAVWARATLFDSGEVAAAVETALEDPAVTDALGAYLADQIVVAVGAEQLLGDALPPALAGLAPAITGGVRTYVADRLAAVLADDDVRAVVVALTERSHRALMRLLDGDGLVDGVTVADGEVSVNLLPLIARGLTVVQELGLLQQVDVPALAADGDPDEQRAELAAALGRDVPDGFGELVVYRSDAVAEAEATVALAQRIVVLAKRALALLVVLTIVAAAGSVWLAQRRIRAALLLLLGGVAAMVVVRAAGDAVIERSPTLVIQPGARAAVASIVASLADGLVTAASIVAVAGALAALLVWATGDGAARVRSGAGSAGSALRGVVAAHPDAVVAAGYVAALLVVLVGGLGLAQLLIAAALVLGGAGLARWARARPLA